MEIILLWVFVSAIVGAIVSDRTIGFWGGFLASLLLSPILGLIIGLLYKSKAQVYRENQMINLQHQTTNELLKMNNTKTSTVDELEKLARLKQDGHITEEEYNKMKSKLL